MTTIEQGNGSRGRIGWAVVLAFGLVALGACGGGGGSEGGGTQAAAAGGGDPARGAEIFRQTCAACHGTEAQGVPGLGKALTGNAFVQAKSDQELLQFLIEGRRAGDPANTTGIDMPPRGGNPSLTDEDLLAVVAYLRTL